MEALVFASSDRPTVHAAASAFTIKLADRGLLNGRLVDKLSSEIEDLRLIARYDVVEPLVIVLLNDDVLVARLTSLPDVAFLERASSWTV